MGNTREYLKKLYAFFSPTYRSVRRMEESLKDLSLQLDRQFDKAETLFWYAINTPGKSLSQTKREFFRAMPEAEGTLRTIQLGCNHLLRQLKRICEENEITYWISFGTLLGAARHNGFIPWDDDVDVSFLRTDFEKLQAALENNKDFTLRPYYCEKGQYFLYKMTSREGGDFFWVDITIWDSVNAAPLGMEGTWECIRRVREKTLQEMAATSFGKSYHNEVLLPADYAVLLKIFEKNRPLLPAAEEPDCIYRSLDSVYLGGETLLRTDEVFPLGELPFEGELYPVPSRYKDYLERIYHYLELPPSFSSGHTHLGPEMARQVREDIRRLGLTDIGQTQ